MKNISNQIMCVTNPYSSIKKVLNKPSIKNQSWNILGSVEQVILPIRESASVRVIVEEVWRYERGWG